MSTRSGMKVRRREGKARFAVVDPESWFVRDGWHYVLGLCGGGVRVKWKGVVIVDVADVDHEEAKRLKSLPVTRRDPYADLLGELSAAQRSRIVELAADVRRRGADLVTAGLEIGAMLLEAKEILGKSRRFGVFLEQLGVSPEKALTAMRIATVTRNAPPAFLEQFQKIGQEKTALMARLPDAKLNEVLTSGVLVDGQLVPIEAITYRRFNSWIRSVVGRDPRGRKARPTEEPKSTLGLSREVYDAFHAVLRGLRLLRQKTETGWAETEVGAARTYWGQIAHRCYELGEHQHTQAMMDRQATK